MFFNYIDRCIELGQELQKYEKLEIEVKQLTGYNFEALRYLFAKGYTLEPPKPTESLLAVLAELAVDEPIDKTCSDCMHYRSDDEFNDFDEPVIASEYCSLDIYKPCGYYREACKDFCEYE